MSDFFDDAYAAVMADRFLLFFATIHPHYTTSTNSFLQLLAGAFAIATTSASLLLSVVDKFVLCGVGHGARHAISSS